MRFAIVRGYLADLHARVSFDRSDRVVCVSYPMFTISLIHT